MLAVDGTRFGDGAVHEAMNFARRCSSRLIVLFPIVATMETESESPLTHEKEESEAETYLGKIKKQAFEMGIPCEGIICEAADAADCIVDEARERAADMIIIGKRGISGWKKLLIGETAANVIGKAPCKVLVVPPDGRLSYKTILNCARWVAPQRIRRS
ncbi:MAG TPA: universal stress protein [Dissulfurispiraceae bacterium]|nr:universal stress protein [Dissulfurispiraceae bacterium]